MYEEWYGYYPLCGVERGCGLGLDVEDRDGDVADEGDHGGCEEDEEVQVIASTYAVVHPGAV